VPVLTRQGRRSSFGGSVIEPGPFTADAALPIMAEIVIADEENA